MDDTTKLYDEDFVLWSREQAEALRAAARGTSDQAIDWENVAEEIESLGISQLRELKSQIRRVIEHLLKLEHPQRRSPGGAGLSRSAIRAPKSKRYWKTAPA